MDDRGIRKVPVRHWLTLTSGFLENLCFSGLAFGWASLVFVLKDDGYFADHCVNGTLMDNSTATDCSGQDEQFSMILSIASFSSNILRFAFGHAFDHLGTTVTRLITTTMFTSGTLLMALSTPEHSFLLFPAMCCLMFSGILFCLTNVQVGNLFESHRSTVITMTSGFTDSSAGGFLVVKLLHEQGVSLRTTFLVFSCGCIWHLISTFFLLPRGHFPYPLPADYKYGLNCPCPGQESREKVTEKRNEGEYMMEVKYETDKPVKVEVPSFRSCVLSLLFLWHLLWTATLQFSHFLYLSTCNPTLSRLADNDRDRVSQYTNVFAYIQTCGILFAPCNGLILDRHKHRPLAQGERAQATDLSPFPLSLALTSLQGFLFCVCFTVPVLPLQYVTFVLQVVNSSFLYGAHQSYISHAFPGCHFGKLSGLVMSLSALTLLLQIPVMRYVKEVLHGDPFYAYLGVTALSLLTFIHPLHVHLHCRRQLSRPADTLGSQCLKNDMTRRP